MDATAKQSASLIDHFQRDAKLALLDELEREIEALDRVEVGVCIMGDSEHWMAVCAYDIDDILAAKRKELEREANK